MAFNFLSLPQAERAEEPAPIDGEERHGYGSFKTSKTSKKSIAADFLPMLSTQALSQIPMMELHLHWKGSSMCWPWLVSRPLKLFLDCQRMLFFEF